ncbi:MAG: Stress protein UspA-like protein [Pedosphaera sp.]|nr:Stress protein UspA-like protein [Pedosphaera sp.]
MSIPAQFQLKTILVPVDFSEPSRSALQCASALAKPFNAEIILLHVVESVLPPPDDFIVDSAALAAALSDDAAHRLAEWHRQFAAHARLQEMLRVGTPYREIVDAADEADADLIVLGTHGRTGLTRLLIGSTAERVVRDAHCPVLVAREREQKKLEVSRGKRPAAKSRSRGTYPAGMQDDQGSSKQPRTVEPKP